MGDPLRSSWGWVAAGAPHGAVAVCTWERAGPEQGLCRLGSQCHVHSLFESPLQRRPECVCWVPLTGQEGQ